VIIESISGGPGHSDQEWRQNQLRKIVIAGGFSAGKSAALNLFLRNPVLESDVGLRDQSLSRLLHKDISEAGAEEQHKVHPTENVEFFDLPSLAGIEIVEIPASIDGEFNHRYLDEFTDASLVIWCTIGSQAWRLSEKSAVEKIRTVYEGPLTLAVTRSDLFRSKEDLEKIRDRLRNDRSDLYSEIVFIGASRSNIAASKDREIWNRSGGGLVAEIIASAPAGARLPKPSVAPPRKGVAEIVQFVPTPANDQDTPEMSSQEDEKLPAKEADPTVVTMADSSASEASDNEYDLQAIPALKLQWEAVCELEGVRDAAIFDLLTSKALFAISSNDAQMNQFLDAGAALFALDEKGKGVEDVAVSRSRDILLFQKLSNSEDIAVFVSANKNSTTIGRLRQSLKEIDALVTTD